MSSNKIVVFGSIVQDLISYTDEFPRPGESVRGHHFLTGGGGKGANQAVAAAKLHDDVHLIGKVGKDIFGDSNLKTLGEAGVDVSGVEQLEEEDTATATITVNSHGENCIVVTLAANLSINENQAEATEHLLSKGTLVMAQQEIREQANKAIFTVARRKGATTFFNPAPGDRSLDLSILKLVDILCTNENEAEFITGLTAETVEEAKKAATKMLQMGPKQVIITLGESGVVYGTSDSEIRHIPVVKVKAVDTTGAGDCFCGSFAALYVKGKAFEECVKRASAIASLSVQRKGTQSSYWTKQEILKDHPELVQF